MCWGRGFLLLHQPSKRAAEQCLQLNRKAAAPANGGSFLGKNAATSSAHLAGQNLGWARRAAGDMLFCLNSLTKLQCFPVASPFPEAQQELFPSLRVPSGEGRKQERL